MAEIMAEIMAEKMVRNMLQYYPGGQCKVYCFAGEGRYSFCFHRLRLAAIHFNFNSTSSDESEPALATDRLTVTYPKHKKGEATVRAVGKQACYGQFCNYFIARFCTQVALNSSSEVQSSNR